MVGSFDKLAHFTRQDTSALDDNAVNESYSGNGGRNSKKCYLIVDGEKLNFESVADLAKYVGISDSRTTVLLRRGIIHGNEAGYIEVKEESDEE